MKADGDEADPCPCRKLSRDGPTGFEKIMDLRKVGLVIYHHKVEAKNVNQATATLDLKFTTNTTTSKAFILVNNNDSDITSTEFLPEMETRATCAQCCHIMEHALKLLHKVRNINRHAVVVTCDHCKSKKQPCYECTETLKKFFQAKNKAKQFPSKKKSIKERVRKGSTKVTNLLKNSGLEKTKKVGINERKREYSDLHVDQYYHQEYMISKCELDNTKLWRESKRPGLTNAFMVLTENSKKTLFFKSGALQQVASDPIMVTQDPLKLKKTKTAFPSFSPQVYQAIQVIPKHADTAERERSVSFQSLEDEDFDISKHTNDDFVQEDTTSLRDQNVREYYDRNTYPASYPRQGAHISTGRKTNLDQSGEINSYKQLLKHPDPTSERQHLGKSFFKNLLQEATEPQHETLEGEFSYTFTGAILGGRNVQHVSSSELLKETRDVMKVKAEREKNRLECIRKTEEKKKKIVAREKAAKAKLAEIMAKKKAAEQQKQETELLLQQQETQSNKKKYRIPRMLLETENKKQSSGLVSRREQNMDHEKCKTNGDNECSGITLYALSDRTFIDKGWTMLPSEKVMRKMNVYRMRPAKPEFNWFEHNKNKGVMFYDTGERFAEFRDNGNGRWFYRNRRMALEYYDAEEINAQQRFVVYSNGEPDERGRPRPYTVLATFDYLGNGIVFDHSGKIRLKYNQTEGVVLDRNIGPVSHWQWHSLNDPPVLQQVMIETELLQKDPQILEMGPPGEKQDRPDNVEMLAIEFNNFMKEKSKKLTQSFKPFQIKIKALKINEHFSLKVLDQANVYLIYRDGKTNLKLNIGMVLDSKEIFDTDTTEVGEVSNNMDRFPARSDSLAELQQKVQHAQFLYKARTERECKLRPPIPCASADKLRTATSRPMRLPFSTVNSCSCATAAANLHGKSRKPSSNNVYYSTT